MDHLKFSHSTISWVVFENKIKMIDLQKQPIFLLNGEVIWQASNSPLSKELHGSANRGKSVACCQSDSHRSGSSFSGYRGHRRIFEGVSPLQGPGEEYALTCFVVPLPFNFLLLFVQVFHVHLGLCDKKRKKNFIVFFDYKHGVFIIAILTGLLLMKT